MKGFAQEIDSCQTPSAAQSPVHNLALVILVSEILFVSAGAGYSPLCPFSCQLPTVVASLHSPCSLTWGPNSPKQPAQDHTDQEKQYPICTPPNFTLCKTSLHEAMETFTGIGVLESVRIAFFAFWVSLLRVEQRNQ